MSRRIAHFITLIALSLALFHHGSITNAQLVTSSPTLPIPNSSQSVVQGPAPSALPSNVGGQGQGQGQQVGGAQTGGSQTGGSQTGGSQTGGNARGSQVGANNGQTTNGQLPSPQTGNTQQTNQNVNQQPTVQQSSQQPVQPQTQTNPSVVAAAPGPISNGIPGSTQFVFVPLQKYWRDSTGSLTGESGVTKAVIPPTNPYANLPNNDNSPSSGGSSSSTKWIIIGSVIGGAVVLFMVGTYFYVSLVQSDLIIVE
jgi:hypothetical protein